MTALFIATAGVGIIAIALSINPRLHAMAPIGLDPPAPTDSNRTPIGAASDVGALALVLTETVVSSDLPFIEGPPAEAPAAAPPLPRPTLEGAPKVPSPPPRPLDAPQSQGRRDVARLPADRAAPQVALTAPASTSQKPLAPRQAHAEADPLSDLDGRTAIYDIEAHTVYLPDGERLEAHSGLGDKLDDPRYVNVKDRGPTPPNVYDLTLRGELFHGVRAIRLNPVDERRTFGRDGMLAHTYMLGPSGQSFGCVSFKDYPAFLRAFQKGEVDRLVVVPHLGTAISRATLAGRGQMAALQSGK